MEVQCMMDKGPQEKESDPCMRMNIREEEIKEYRYLDI